LPVANTLNSWIRAGIGTLKFFCRACREASILFKWIWCHFAICQFAICRFVIVGSPYASLPYAPVCRCNARACRIEWARTHHNECVYAGRNACARSSPSARMVNRLWRTGIRQTGIWRTGYGKLANGETTYSHLNHLSVILLESPFW